MPQIFQSIRFRLIVLVLATGLPALGVLIYQGIQSGRSLTKQHENRVWLLAEQLALDLEVLVEAAEDLLRVVAAAPALRPLGPGIDARACTEFLSGLATANQRYSTFFLTDSRGAIVCAPAGTPAGLRFDDRSYFQQVLKTGAFAIGELITGRLTGEAVLPVAYPISGADGAVDFVLVSALRSGWLDRHFTGAATLEGATVSLIDREGRILVHLPDGEDVTGKPLPEPGLLDLVKRIRNGVTEAPGPEGAGHFYGIATIGSMPFGHVIVDVPLALTVTPFYRGLTGAILLVVMVTALSLALAWIFGGALILAPIQRLQAATEGMRRGDLTRRVGPDYRKNELSALGMAFDEMADAIQRREQHLESQAEDLRRANAELEEKDQVLRQAQKMEIVGQLAGGIAHDFNNLLTVILGNLQLLERRFEGDDKGRRLASAASGAALRGAQLTGQLLAFSRRQVLDPDRIDVNALIVEMDEILNRTLGADIEINLLLGEELWPARADSTQLETALLNLLVNARDVMPEGGAVTIETANRDLRPDEIPEVSDATPGSYVTITVSDTGPGMSPEVRQKAFEPFFTTKGRGKGTGLGLSMVYGFVKQSGGHIQLDSRLGEGTAFTIYLPKAEAGSGQTKRSGMESNCEPASPGGETILVVEDEEDVRETAVKLLTDLGYKVLEASDGPEALRMLRQHHDIDLLFTDIVMPGGMTGVQLGHLAVKERPNLRVLYTSGYTSRRAADIDRLNRQGQFLKKPYLKATLARKLSDLLQVRDRSA